MSQTPPEKTPTPDEAQIRAALPDFEAPRIVKVRRESAASSVGSGCALGVLLNFVLGFVLIGLQRIGVPIYGPGALAIAVALVVLLAILREWPSRTLLGFAGVVLGMIFTFMALRLFVQPLLQSATDAPSPRESAPQSAPRGNVGGSNS